MIDLPSSGQPRAIASTAYDTAWVAAVPSQADRRNPRFPSALSWISRNQLADGSWGSAIPYQHDRIICTLAALIPLARFGQRETDRVQVQRGERYLWQHAHRLRHMPCELVGFELLLPTLLQLATEVGIRVPPGLDVFAAERQAKLALLPPQLIYSAELTTAHSLEFLGADVNPLKLLHVRAPNGSIGNSPAATAFLLHHIDDPAATAYLDHCLLGDQGAGVPVLEPCETFEQLWIALHGYLGGTPVHTLLDADILTSLQQQVNEAGICLSASFPVPDADDTAVALLLLHAAGLPADPIVLQAFERDDYFVSFQYERHPSTGVNIHVLHMLTRYPSYPGCSAAIAKIVRFLRTSCENGSYWIDKWHISPYYATSHAIAALVELAAAGLYEVSDLITAAVRWMVHTQNEDGSWGFYGTPTAEETAYAVLGLRQVADFDLAARAALVGGIAYLQAHRAAPHPALWIDKCLYYPPRVVEAVIAAALDQLEIPLIASCTARPSLVF